MELQEAAQISHGLQPANVNRNTSSLHDMKAIVKTWRNRLPIISDDLSHWSDIFTWRQHHYQFIVNHYDSQVCLLFIELPFLTFRGKYRYAPILLKTGKSLR